jgi:parallel beta-helix repeat protein
MVRNNIFSNKWTGIGLFWSSYHNTIIDNNIYSNEGSGICLSGIPGNNNNNTITGNNIHSNNGGGIYLCYSSNYNDIVGNNIENNGWCGVILDATGGVCLNNLLYLNNFIDNQINAIDYGSNIWDNGRKGNYWSDYKERYPNARKMWLKGVWSIPYEILGRGNEDRYPLIKAYKETEGKNIESSNGLFGICDKNKKDYIENWELITRSFRKLIQS